MNTKINIRLSTELAKAFETRASKAGVTKSNLIRSWITKTSSLKLDTKIDLNSSHKQTSYSFHIDTDTLQELKLRAQRVNMCCSTLIRLIMIVNLGVPAESEKQLKSQEEILWSNGDYLDLVQYLDTTENPTPEQNMYITNAYIRLGKLESATLVLDDLDKQCITAYENNYNFIRLNVLRAHIARLGRKMSLCESIIKRFLSIAHQMKFSDLVGEMYCLLGDIYNSKDRTSEALNFYETSLVYLDAFSSPLQIVEAYLRIASMLSYQEKYEESNRNLKRAENILKSNSNNYFYARYLNTKALICFLQNNLDKADRLVRESIILNKQNGSQKELLFSYENEFRIALLKGDFRKVRKTITKAQSIERQYRPEASFSRSSLFEAYSQLEIDYDKSMNKMKYLSRQCGVPIKANLQKYVIATSQYLYGTSSQEKERGRRELKMLAETGDYKLIKDSAIKTLHQEKLQPFR